MLNTDKLGPMHRNTEVCRCFSMTFNAYGVYYKNLGKLEQSIRYLKKVVDLEEKMDICYTQQLDLSQSYINVCAVFA